MSIPAAPRLIAYILVVNLFVYSCSTSGPSDLYPTYDPFAPVNGASSQVAPAEVGEFVRATQMAGATPSRAPISVNIPAHNPNSAQTTPTPDAPHALPTQRDFLDQYTVESGDTLGNIAQKYGITLEALMQANGLNESSLLTVGMVLKIPPIEADPTPGSSLKIVPDSELVYGPASAQFDLESFVHEQNGYLASYTQDVNGETLSGVQIITQISQSYSVNPRLLLALLEYRGGWVTNPSPDNVDYPLGFQDNYYM